MSKINNRSMPISQKNLETVRDWIRYTVSSLENAHSFFGHGVTNSYDEAVWLVMGVLHLPFDLLDTFLDARLLPEESDLLSNLIEKRTQQYIPTAYLLREAWILDYKFYVDERALIPRSLMAEFLKDGLSECIEYPDLVERIADICTGSGCLGIILADAFQFASIDIVDISADALAVAKINVDNYRLNDRINLILGDMLSKLTGKYDLIVSNPPYVDSEAMVNLPREYQHEPQIALGSGDDGLDYVRILLQKSIKYLKEDGYLLVEIGHNRETLLSNYPTLRLNWLNEFVFIVSQKTLASHFS